MSMIKTSRASYQPKPKIAFGQKSMNKYFGTSKRRNMKVRVCNDVEQGQINRMIDLLSQCKVVSKEATFKYNMSEVFRLAREITSQRT